MVLLALKSTRAAYDGHTPELTEIEAGRLGTGDRRIGQVQVNVSVHKEIQSPIAVVVAKGCACGPRADCDACFFRDIGKGSVVVVMVEAVLTVIGYIEVGPAVVVVIAYGAPVSPTVVGNSGRACHLGECAIVIIMKERRVWRSGFARKRIVG